jgi:uncharacterized membrane protein required for colicin V production
MNLLDVVIVVIFLGCLIISLARGLIVSVFALAGIYFGLKIAGEYYSIIGELLGMVISPKAANIIGYIITCLFIMLLAAHIGLLFKGRITSIAFFRVLDRIGGLLFGLVMGIIVWVLILVVLVNYTNFDIWEPVDNSRIASFVSYLDYSQEVAQFTLKVIAQFP